MSDITFFTTILFTRLKCFPGSLSEMAVLGVCPIGWQSQSINTFFISSLNMVLAGKDPMFCLSGKLRFVFQVCYRLEANF